MAKSIYPLNDLVVYSNHGFERFILFGYESYEAAGGTGDIVLSSDNIEEIITTVNEFMYSTRNPKHYDVIEVYDSERDMAKVDIEATRKAIEKEKNND